MRLHGVPPAEIATGQPHELLPLDAARKSLQKLKASELRDFNVLDQYLRLATSISKTEAGPLESTAYLVIFFRQLLQLFSLEPSYTLPKDEYEALEAALAPDGTIANLVLAHLNSKERPLAVRSLDTFVAICRVAAVLPAPAASSSAPTYILAPLLASILRSSLTSKVDLVALSVLVEHAPPGVIPGDLCNRLIADLANVDLVRQRCGVIAHLLVRAQEDVFVEGTPDYRATVRPLASLLREQRLSSTARTHLERYVLPDFIRLLPASIAVLLEAVHESVAVESDQAVGLRAWVAVASLSISDGALRVAQLHQERLAEALEHADDDIRVRVFHALTASKSLLDRDVLQLIQRSLVLNTILPSPSARQELSGAVHGFFVRLKSAQAVAARAARKDEEQLACTKTAEQFHRWFINEYLTPSIANARRHPAIRAIHALRLLEIYLDVYEDDATKDIVFSADRVDLLLSCQASDFGEIRSRARSILDKTTSLPGYETMYTTKSTALSRSAMTSVNHPRQTQAEAGRAAHRIIFTHIVTVSAGSANNTDAIEYAHKLVDDLELALRAVEDGLVENIAGSPLHGRLSAINGILSCITIQSVNDFMAYRPLLVTLVSQIERVWHAVRPVISLSGPAADSGQVAHEIARAYEVLAEGDHGGDEDADEESDHTNLLSSCWRAIKDAADLLSTIFTLPFALQGSTQQIWDVSDIDKAGRQFLEWLHEIRHRGTFSKIAPAFGRLADTLRNDRVARPLVSQWLDVSHDWGSDGALADQQIELDNLASGQHSTTRRSAALPYSILALVAADSVLLDRVVDHLIALGQVTSSSTDDTKVHALNTLKIVLLDARHSKLYTKYLERGVLVGLQGLGSSDWNVRNVALLLFTTLANRALTVGRSQPDFKSRQSLAARLTLSSWAAAYPGVIDHVANVLLNAAPVINVEDDVSSHARTHAALLPALIIIRNLQWSSDGEPVAKRLRPLVRPFVSSIDWQVRIVAAQAASSLLSPTDAAASLRDTMARYAAGRATSANEQHGDLLHVELLLHGAAWCNLEDTSWHASSAQSTLSALSKDVAASPLVTAALFDCVGAYLRSPITIDRQVVAAAKLAAKASMLRRRTAPGYDRLVVSATAILLCDASDDDLQTMLESDIEDVCLAALDLLRDDRTRTDAVQHSLLKISSSPSKHSLAVQIQAYEALVRSNAPGSYSALVHETVLGARTALQHSRCVPLREAALPVLGWCAASLDMRETEMAQLASVVERMSHEDESEPSRDAALQCLSNLAPRIFLDKQTPATTVLQCCLLRLLQDDDDEIRLGAANVLLRGCNRSTPVVQCEAVELWWRWLSQQVQDPANQPLWEQWLVDAAAQLPSINWELGELGAGPGRDSDILFHVEPSNIFRDDFVDMSHAAAVLASVPQWRAAHGPALEATWQRVAVAVAQAPVSSPIDAAWHAAHTLIRRVTVQRRAFESAG